MLAISEEFDSYQGEGTLSGTRMYFVRTQGCAVGCHFCDTKFTWKKEDQTTHEEEIVKRAVESGCSWVCITGGEPLEQNIVPLIDLLHKAGLLVQIETSGMYIDHDALALIDHVVVSPKDLFSKKIPADEVTRYADEVKCVITKDEDIDYYLNKYSKFVGTRILQPVDSNPEVAQLVLNRPAKAIQKWLLMTQQQKVLNLR